MAYNGLLALRQPCPFQRHAAAPLTFQIQKDIVRSSLTFCRQTCMQRWYLWWGWLWQKTYHSILIVSGPANASTVAVGLIEIPWFIYIYISLSLSLEYDFIKDPSVKKGQLWLGCANFCFHMFSQWYPIMMQTALDTKQLTLSPFQWLGPSSLLLHLYWTTWIVAWQSSSNTIVVSKASARHCQGLTIIL